VLAALAIRLGEDGGGQERKSIRPVAICRLPACGRRSKASLATTGAISSYRPIDVQPMHKARSATAAVRISRPGARPRHSVRDRWPGRSRG
jgi:hypothetical protein